MKRLIWCYVIFFFLLTNTTTCLISYKYGLEKRKAPIYVTHKNLNLEKALNSAGIKLTPEQKKAIEEQLKGK